MRKIICLAVLMCICFSGVSAVYAKDIDFADISIDAESSVTHGLVLPDEWEGETVTWTSSDSSVVDVTDGTVKRPYPSDKAVTITANYGTKSKSFDITVKAFESKKEIVQTAAQYLSFTDISVDDSNFIENDLFLPSEGLYGTKILWHSDNSSLINIIPNGTNYIGEVNKTYFGEGNHGVCLTATFYFDNEFYEKYFYLNVAEMYIGYTFPERITSVRNKYRDEFFSKNNIFDLRSDLILPQIDTNVTIECFSGNEIYITNEGIVKRDSDYNKRAEFTVTFSEGYIKTYLTIPITVTAYTNDELENIPEQDVKNLFAELSREYSLNFLIKDINLKSEGKDGSTITWKSSDTSVMSDTGVIKRGETDKKVTLTATAEYKGFTYSESIDVTVRRNSTAETSVPLSGVDAPAITETPTQPENPSNVVTYFKDMSSDHWAYDSIMRLRNEGVIGGYEDNTFRPDNAVSREEFVKMLLLATNSYKENCESDFGDVPKDSWYYKYVSCAYENNIVQGIDAQVFGSGFKLLRQDAAVMICRALGFEPTEIDVTVFPDFDGISDYAQSAVSSLYERGIIRGDDEGYFNPKKNITRAEVAIIVDLIM